MKMSLDNDNRVFDAISVEIQTNISEKLIISKKDYNKSVFFL